jgi:hypothetical protein
MFNMENNIRVTIALKSPDLDDQELQESMENLLPQLREVDGVEQANLVAVEEIPEGAKAVGGFLVGMLKAEVNPASIKALFSFLGDHLSGKTIEMEVEANGKKLKVKAGSQAELMAAIQAAREFVTA